jgi:hypothetical protein
MLRWWQGKVIRQEAGQTAHQAACPAAGGAWVISDDSSARATLRQRGFRGRKGTFRQILGRGQIARP